MCGPGVEILLLVQEDCVICKDETDWTMGDDVEDRDHTYIKGVGQLCNRCWKEYYANQL